jgi:hypothetical protein
MWLVVVVLGASAELLIDYVRRHQSLKIRFTYI